MQNNNEKNDNLAGLPNNTAPLGLSDSSQDQSKSDDTGLLSSERQTIKITPYMGVVDNAAMSPQVQPVVLLPTANGIIPDTPQQVGVVDNVTNPVAKDMPSGQLEHDVISRGADSSTEVLSLPSIQPQQDAMGNNISASSGSQTTESVPGAPVMAFGGVVDSLGSSHGGQKLFFKIGLGFASVLLVTGASFGVYFFGVRVPEKSYDDALTVSASIAKKVDTLKLASREIVTPSLQGVSEVLGMSSANSSISTEEELTKKIIEAKKLSQDCQDSIVKLGELGSVAKNASVESDYKAAKISLNNYCKALQEAIQTAEIVLPLKDIGERLTSTSTNVKSVAEYDAALKEMKDFFTQHPTVPYADYNDKVYVPLRKALLAVVDTGRATLVAVEAKDKNTAYTKVKELSSATADLYKVSKAAADYKPTIPESPIEKLQALDQTLKSQKTVLFRL